MDQDFISYLYSKQHQTEQVPPNSSIQSWADGLICLLFPELSNCAYTSQQALEKELNRLQEQLCTLMKATSACADCNFTLVSKQYFNLLPQLYHLLKTDIDAIHQGDPAAQTEFEVIRAYPGFIALSYYRLAHALHELTVPLLPRILTELAHSKTGIDIHPGAGIGEYFMIDHGTGVVIGETAEIGDHVKIYQGVTLGALSVDKNMATKKRHPSIGNKVIIYSGATILGGDTVVGDGSVIGGNVWLTQSVPPGSLVYHSPEITVVEGKYLNP